MKRKQQKLLSKQRLHRVKRVRSKVSGTKERPRLAVYRSLRYLSAQVVDDENGITLFSVHQRELKEKIKPMESATALGKLLVEKAVKAGVKNIVFDRRHYKYHGLIKAFAETAREAGLIF